MVVGRGQFDSPTRDSAKTRLVLNISRMTVHNGPGIRTLIRFKGCPLHCVWCSTPESQDEKPEIAVFPGKCIRCNQCIEACPSNAVCLRETTLSIDRSVCDACGKCVSACYCEALRLLGQPMNVGELVREAQKDEVAYRHSGGGVTLSGGEPLLEMEFTLALLRALSEAGIGVGVDTSGCVPSRDLELALPYVRFFLWDIKTADEDRHREFTGASNRLILDNLDLVAKRGVPVYVRIPLITGFTDSRENVNAICEIARGLASLVEVDLLPLHHLGMARYASLDRRYPIEGVPLVSDSNLQDFKSQVESYGLRCSIVG
jgi:pyruvate formate lyase activating enzyme